MLTCHSLVPACFGTADFGSWCAQRAHDSTTMCHRASSGAETRVLTRGPLNHHGTLVNTRVSARRTMRSRLPRADGTGGLFSIFKDRPSANARNPAGQYSIVCYRLQYVGSLQHHYGSCQALFHG